MLYRFQGFAAAEPDLAHVADIEKAAGSANGHVFGVDAGILDRQVPAAEFDHFTLENVMGFVEFGFFHFNSQK